MTPLNNPETHPLKSELARVHEADRGNLVVDLGWHVEVQTYDPDECKDIPDEVLKSLVGSLKTYSHTTEDYQAHLRKMIAFRLGAPQDHDPNPHNDTEAYEAVESLVAKELQELTTMPKHIDLPLHWEDAYLDLTELEEVTAVY